MKYRGEFKKNKTCRWWYNGVKRAGRNMGCSALRNKEGGRGIDGIDKSQGDCMVPAHLPYHSTAFLCCTEGDFEIEIKYREKRYCAVERE
jgi:hypothetical protein